MVSMSAIVISMIAATVIEKIYGTHSALDLVYHNPVFIILWAVAAVSGLILAIRVGMPKRIPVMTLHIALALILAGALTTYLTSDSGRLHLRTGTAMDYFENDDYMRAPLPFTLELKTFRIDYHAGSDAPKDYSSKVAVTDRGRQFEFEISMNHPLKYHGYRFYQSSFDHDMNGTLLSVSHDPWGVPISYAGYYLLMASLFGFFFVKQSGFRAALARISKWAAVIALLMVSAQASAQTASGPMIGEEQDIAVPAKAESIYHKMDHPKPLAIGLVTLGMVLSVVTGVLTARGKKIPHAVVQTEISVAVAVFVFLTLVLGLRWYVQHHIPMASGFEMMMLIAWCAMLAAWAFMKRLPVLAPMAFILAGFALLVAGLGSHDSQMEPLKPVLASPLLAIHVGCMMVSYTLFGLAAFNGIMGLAIRNSEARSNLADISMVILYPSVFLLTTGTFLGAIWANVSWGNYWMWDPKETWALITILVYAASLHGASLPRFRDPRFLHLFTIVSFLCVLITYFGVNMVLGGMHSYS